MPLTSDRNCQDELHTHEHEKMNWTFRLRAVMSYRQTSFTTVTAFALGI